MRRKNLPDLDSRVQTFVHDWEELVTQQLQATKVKLLWCSGQERAELKNHLETLVAVVDLLQGRRSKETCNRELSEEISGLKARLGRSEAEVRLLLAAFQAQKKLNKDLKVQLRRQFKVSLTAERKNQELRQQLKNQENRVSPGRPGPQTPADQDPLQDPGTRKGVQAPEREAPRVLRGEEPRVELQEKKERRRRRRERPADEQRTVAGSGEEKRAESRAVAPEKRVWSGDVTSDRWAEPVGVASVKRPESEGVASETWGESRGVASETWAESRGVPSEKRAESGGVASETRAEPVGMAADLRAALMKVCQQLQVQHQGLKELLDQRDRRWEEKFLELRTRMEKLESKKKRRSWF